MRFVQGIPFLRITLPFIIGILFNKYWNFIGPINIGVLILSTLIGLLFFGKLKINQRIKLTWTKGILIHVLLICAGFLVANFHNTQNHATWYRHHITKNSKVKAKIIEPLKETAKTYKTIAEICAVYTNGREQPTSGTAILYFRKSDSLPTLKVDDQIILVNNLNPIISRGNPGEFDYAGFCQNKGTYDQAFLTNNEWTQVKNEPPFFKSPFGSLHQKIKSVIAQNITDSSAQGIALALITGYRDDIDKQVYNNYTKTGLVHLLAISGLHMGIFYGSTLFILGFIPFFKKRNKWLIVVSLVVMWLFALVTTFPPSVQRASIMFTFLGIGQLIDRKIPSVNFLFASAFFILLFQPNLLFEVGFQLSYAAVLGILLFFRPLRNWYFPSNRIIKFLWEIMCLSLSAQLFTFPIAIYYFHQLPVLFLITNLVAIPIVMLIIYGEVIMLTVSFIPIASKFMGTIVTSLINFLNQFIEYSSSLNFVSIQNINISLLQCFLLLGLMLAISIWFLAKQKIFAAVAIVFFIAFISIAIIQKSNQLEQSKIVIYNTNTPYLEVFDGNCSYTQDTIAQDEVASFNQYILKPSHLHYGITQSSSTNYLWESQLNFDYLYIKDKRIIRIRKANKLASVKPITVDYLIISDKWIKNPADLVTFIQAKEIIIDGNIPLWKIEDIKSQLSELNLPIHFVGTDGAKIISI